MFTPNRVILRNMWNDHTFDSQQDEAYNDGSIYLAFFFPAALVCFLGAQMSNISGVG